MERIPDLYADPFSVSEARHRGIGITELAVMKQGRCTVPVFLQPLENGWQPISTVPKDGTEILVGKYHAGDGYNKTSRWVWIVMGSYEDDQFWCSYVDAVFSEKTRVGYHEATHWKKLHTDAPDIYEG